MKIVLIILLIMSVEAVVTSPVVCDHTGLTTQYIYTRTNAHFIMITISMCTSEFLLSTLKLFMCVLAPLSV